MIAIEFYTSQINVFTKQKDTLKKRKSAFGFMRLGSIVVIIILFYFLWNISKVYTILSVVFILIIFIKLIHKDLANRAAIKHLDYLININKNELLAIDGKYFHFENGENFNPKNHYYAADMDVFGHASLYQFINRTTSQMGAQLLADSLLTPAPIDVIVARQTAVKELVKLTACRQQFEATGKAETIQNASLTQLQQWLSQPTIFLQFKPWQWLRWVLPAIILAACVLTIFGITTMQLLYPMLLHYFLIAYQINKLVAPVHNQLSPMVKDLAILSQSLAIIETQEFNAPLLQQLKAQLYTQTNTSSTKIKALKNILDKLDIRYNIAIAMPLNILLLWNLQQIIDLEKWKKQQATDVQKWFETLAQFEALNSMATLHFNNPNWCMPTITNTHFNIAATQLGHPLIPAAKSITNYININHAGEIMLVTGSNMAGKSTYLRSIGINTILAMAGAAVCAKTFSLSAVQLISSMRIADNLEENTSTFYAELKKLKTVIEKINAGEKVFILLDEILRGTNSLDRHTGSEALIRQLIKQKATAILATHDVALAALETEYPSNILNFHFDAQVSGEELFFDYKLKNGVCTNLNASLLMKKIGLEV